MRGFTLIEIAIVMVVVGLLLSGGLLAVAPVLQSSRTTDTNQKLDRLEQALILHVIRNGCLPCPANPALATGDTNAGRSQTGAATYYTTGCTASACHQTGTLQGGVPWFNLGLSEADTIDGFGFRIDYALTAGLQNTNGMVRTPPAGYPAGLLAVNVASGGTSITAAAAYVLVSHGPDRALAYNSAGLRSGDPNGSTDQAANSDGTPFVQKSVTAVSGVTYFDDSVRWRTAPLIIQLCGTNACGNPA